MEYKLFKDGIKLSRLGMGNMRLPVKAGTEEIDYERSQEIIDYAMKSGINYYDTAYAYFKGESERFVGTALKKYKRDSFYIATKWHIDVNRDYKKVFEEELEKLQTDYIDFYLIHCITDKNVDSYFQSGGIEFFRKMKEEGKIKYLGFSSHASVETLKRFADSGDWDFAQLQINYYDWNYSKTKEEYKVLEERGIPTMVMEPVRGGRLAVLSSEAEELLRSAHKDWSMARWAFHFVRSLPNTQVILSGMSNLDQIKDNVETFNKENVFTEEDEKTLFKACEIFHDRIHIPCTACRYCIPECPMQINIPEYLKVLNEFKSDGAWALKGLKDIKSLGTPTSCIACGNCMAHCPQQIKIPNLFEELNNILDSRK